MTLETMEAFGARVGRRRRRRSPSRPAGTGPRPTAVEPDAGAAGVLLRRRRAHRRPGGRGRACTGGRARATSRFSTCSRPMGADVSETGRPDSRSADRPRSAAARSTSRPCPTPRPRSPRWPPSPSDEVRVTGIGFIRGKESDRIAASSASCAAAASTPRRRPRASSSGPARSAPADDRDLRRPPHGDGLRAAGPAGARHPHRRPRVRGQDLPGVLRGARPAAGRPPAAAVGSRADEGDRHRRAGRVGQVDRRPAAGRAARARLPRHRRHVPGGDLRRAAPRDRPVRRRRRGASWCPTSRSTWATGRVEVDGVDATIEIRGPGGHPGGERRGGQPRGAGRAAPPAAGVGGRATAAA